MSMKNTVAQRSDSMELQNVIETIPALVVCALPDGTVEFVNRAWQEYTGCSPQKLNDSGWRSIIHADDLAKFVEEWDAALSAGRSFETEARIHRADGQYGWFLIKKALAVSGTQNGRSSLRTLIAFEDIDARKCSQIKLQQSEHSLRRSEGYLAKAETLARIGSWAYETASRKLVYLSQGWYRIYGFDPKDGIPTWEEGLQHVHPEDRAELLATIRRAIAQKSDYDVEFRILIPRAPIKFVRSVGEPVLGPSGEVLQFVGVAMDVTESRRAEEERERLRHAQAELAHISRVNTMGELTASLAHEIKQPIGAAVTNAEACFRLLDRDQPDIPEAREAALEMVKDARRAADIIDRVRLLYQKGSSHQDALDVNDVIREMVIMLQNEANRHSITMRTDFAEGLPNVMADRVQLQQVLMNLMLNSIEAMRGTSGELSIKSQLADDGQLLISVSDTGVGLAADHLEQIFNPFFTTKSQGTGLGLAITRSIVEAHGGRIWATRNSGSGATFHFTLPGRAAIAA